MAAREIWFKRIAWGFFPVHWKGLGLLLGAIAVVVPSM